MFRPIRPHLGLRKSLHRVAGELSRSVDRFRFGPPVAYVYNPLDYAWSAHAAYLDAIADASRDASANATADAGDSGRCLLLGMNPGPWGMAQTGVPFGTVSLVRDFLGLGGHPIGGPADVHPKKPVDGFACRREEVSGTRLWGWVEQRWGTAAAFFEDYVVLNYCPLLFLDEGGRNLTPDKLRAAELGPLLDVCDDALRAFVEVLRPSQCIGVGAFAEKRLRLVLADGAPNARVPIGRILHPSPASPAANRGWSASAEEQLRALGAPLPA